MTGDVEPDIMTWFPRKEDYDTEQAVTMLPDETYEEKLERLHDMIEIAQTAIKEVVDGTSLSLEHKIYKMMDMGHDMGEISKLLKECEDDKEAANQQEALKRGRVGVINLKAYMDQADTLGFATELRNEFLFKVGSMEGFGPWLANAEIRVKSVEDKPKNFDEAMEYEQKSCLFLKETVRGNKMLKRLQAASEGIRANIEVQDQFSKLSERYYVLCKKADARVKNTQHLLIEWKALDEILAPSKPEDMDDLQVKAFVSFLRTYAQYFS